ncbi:MAG TPA: hypothetical protein VL155_07705 [Terriglobales bacterium]|jgi:hypothetical protein|nr:hypothetical protein [Terriglobales bacterium]
MTHMDMGSTALWLMLLLGAYHGINPGMGWLFAVALGMQERKGSAVARALAPIALGHALSIGIVVMAAAFLGMALPREAIRYPVAALLFGLGVFSMVRHYHPRWVRMQVGFRDLTVWSFLMASAHGAGLMLLPVLLGSSTVEAASQMAGHHHTSGASSPLAALLATGVHTTAYLAVTGLIAWVVYSKLGVAVLRKAWLNLNLVWAAALVVTSVVTLLM